MATRTVAQDAVASIRRTGPISPAVLGGFVRAADVFVVAAIAFGVYFLYVFPGPGELGGPVSTQYGATVVISVLLAAALFQWFGVYSGDFVFARWLRADRMLVAWAVTFALLLALAFALKISTFYSRVWLVSSFAGTAGVLGIGRLVLGHWIGMLARGGHFARRAVIVGAGEQGQRLARHLRRHADARFRVLGFVDDRTSRVPPEVAGLPLLGNVEQLIRMIRSGLVEEVFLALPWSAEDRQRQLLLEISTTPVPIRLAPDLVGFAFAGRRFAEVAHLPVLPAFDRPISGWSQVAKAAEDRVLATLLLIFLAPLLAVFALAIRLDSPGPVFFRQERQGFNNSLFRVWKFRTMYREAADPAGAAQATRDDQRVTRVGHFLRRASLDELPQLFNVLAGDMSLVGPRPHALGTKAAGRSFAEVVDRYAARHKVKPGITGWAQVNGWRGETDTVDKIQQRVTHDLYYIDNWSIGLDLLILLKTAVILFTNKNAY